MSSKITGREFKFFLIGMLTMFAFEVIYNWEENVESFKQGYAEGQEAGAINNRLGS